MTTTERSTASSGDEIELTLPLRPASAAMLRTVATAVGADASMSVDEIDDLRLALNEAWALMLSGGPGGSRCTVTVVPTGRQVTVRLVATDGRSPAAPDELSERILRAVVDHLTIDAESVTLVKTATETAS